MGQMGRMSWGVFCCVSLLWSACGQSNDPPASDVAASQVDTLGEEVASSGDASAPQDARPDGDDPVPVEDTGPVADTGPEPVQDASDASTQPQDAPPADAVAPPDGFCMALCLNVFDDAGNDYCDETTQLRAYWPTQEDCAASCAALPDEPARYRFIGCVYGSGCGDVAVCESPPSEDYPECEGSCDAIFALCGQLGGITELATCPPLCTGVFMHFPSLNPDAAACIAEQESCGASPADASFGIVMDCMLAVPESCGVACEAVVPCVPPEEELTQDSCETYCAMGGFGDPEVVGACMSAAGDVCDAVFACLAEDGPPVPPLCAAMCGKLTDECGLPSFACEQGCAEEMEAGSTVSAAGKLCILMADCAEIDVCQGLDESNMPADCYDACMASPDACSGLPGGCEAACQGVAAAVPELFDKIDCIMAAAGPTCALDQISGCF